MIGAHLTAEQRGMAAALASPALWGFAPLYFHYLTVYPIDEILAQRAFWAAIFMTGLMIAMGHWPLLRACIQTRGQLAGLTAGAVLVTVNWTGYLYAVGTSQIIESAFGYFIYPLMAIALGIAVFGDRLDRRGWLALLAAGAGVLVKATQLDGVPYIALIIGASFAVYALVRKRLNVDAFAGMVIELLMIAPFMAAYLLYLTVSVKGTAAQILLDGTAYGAFMAISSGIVTAVPLVLFHIGNRHLSLTVTGFLFYINPSLQLAIGVFVFSEPFGMADLMAFSLIWTALVLQFARLPKKRGPVWPL